ncbi:hypothetical protein MGYG_02754 [Nannizzia gypsea CBS 118893]|uniref:Uncharacterized protein n=1 Tax=Arthroderma gypseum (strain ATCC MYA-4604 / CBS 118893) TaxID=535722 RepID=E4UNY8_ARTGP|nr:hypothetical protein MGYG_02754 [Nannizzia gypsea CBS 118893]EFQ99741.1 hypothetical protein MGYG_02754 [Nannizzia gypsea CBS 118893]
MAPGASRRDEQLMEKWLASEEVKDYMASSVKWEVAALPSRKIKCKQRFAKLFYEIEPPHTPHWSRMELPGPHSRGSRPQSRWERVKIFWGSLCLCYWQWLIGGNLGKVFLILAAIIGRITANFTKKGLL